MATRGYRNQNLLVTSLLSILLGLAAGCGGSANKAVETDGPSKKKNESKEKPEPARGADAEEAGGASEPAGDPVEAFAAPEVEFLSGRVGQPVDWVIYGVDNASRIDGTSLRSRRRVGVVFTLLPAADATVVPDLTQPVASEVRVVWTPTVPMQGTVKFFARDMEGCLKAKGAAACNQREFIESFDDEMDPVPFEILPAAQPRQVVTTAATQQAVTGSPQVQAPAKNDPACPLEGLGGLFNTLAPGAGAAINQGCGAVKTLKGLFD